MMNLEQLKATGMTEEQAMALMNTIKEEDGEKLKYPVVKALRKVDCTECPDYANHLVAGVIKNESGENIGIQHDFGNRPTIRILKKLIQHTKYIQNKKNENITSNILPLKDSKKCRCLKTGKLIKELKYDEKGNVKDPDIKGQQPTLMVAKDINTGEWIPCVMFIHGKTYNGFITEKTKPFSKSIRTEMTFTLHAGKKGSVPFLIPIDFEYNELSWEEYLSKCAINDAEYIESFDKWVEGVNSRLNENKEMEVEKEVEPANDNPFFE